MRMVAAAEAPLQASIMAESKKPRIRITVSPVTGPVAVDGLFWRKSKPKARPAEMFGYLQAEHIS
jgi:hypothetical protein